MEENKKETPVELLFQELWDTPKDKFTWYSILNKALEKEKEELTNAFIWGETNEYQKEQFDIILYNSSNDYYDKTYKK